MSANNSSSQTSATPELQVDIGNYLEVIIKEGHHSQHASQGDNPTPKPTLAHSNNKTWGPMQTSPNPHEIRHKNPAGLTAYTQQDGYNPRQVRFTFKMKNGDLHHQYRFNEPRARVPPQWIAPNSYMQPPPAFSNWMDKQYANTFFPRVEMIRETGSHSTTYTSFNYDRYTYNLKHICRLTVRLAQKYEVDLTDVISDLSKMSTRLD